ncbi:LysR family transcriptional regulator [Rhodoferax sediminis]|nr:LysR family transcriptional regulator [Rhodoferax sediminis]
MHIKDVDLNLLRLFETIFRTRNVSRAAELLDLTQPAASQGLMRLRLLLKDPLFERAPGGVKPTPRAERLAVAVQLALAAIEQALTEDEQFDPANSQRLVRLHMSDIGECVFMPPLMQRVMQVAPGLRLELVQLEPAQVVPGLDSGHLNFAVGFLPTVTDTRRERLLDDRYVLLLRGGHPLVKSSRGKAPTMAELRRVELVAVRSHSDTLRILKMLKLEKQLRMTTTHYLVLPAIVKATDLGVVMPRNIAREFNAGGGYAILEPKFPLRDFTVSLHWSRRFEADPCNRWLRQTLVDLFAE